MQNWNKIHTPQKKQMCIEQIKHLKSLNNTFMESVNVLMLF